MARLAPGDTGDPGTGNPLTIATAKAAAKPRCPTARTPRHRSSAPCNLLALPSDSPATEQVSSGFEARELSTKPGIAFEHLLLCGSTTPLS